MRGHETPSEDHSRSQRSLYVAASVNKDVMRSALGKILKRAKLCVKSKGSTFDEDLSIEHAEKTTKIMTHL